MNYLKLTRMVQELKAMVRSEQETLNLTPYPRLPVDHRSLYTLLDDVDSALTSITVMISRDFNRNKELYEGTMSEEKMSKYIVDCLDNADHSGWLLVPGLLTDKGDKDDKGGK